jgi:hypothetical protein
MLGYSIAARSRLVRSGPAAVAMVEAFNTGSRGGLSRHASSALGIREIKASRHEQVE